MSLLVVVAHPDDEVLGAGATIQKEVMGGEQVNVCILSGQADARAYKPSEKKLILDMNNSMDLLGIRKRIIGNFPNIKLNIVPHLEVVQFIEKAIIDCNATRIITHHPGDLNHDHYQASIACQEAFRLFQRRSGVKAMKELLYMEVLSSTEWTLNPSFAVFRPNTFVEVGKEGIENKIKSLKKYEGVMREYPHPRSEEAILGLAAYRGAQAGVSYAEAFECVFRTIDSR